MSILIIDDDTKWVDGIARTLEAFGIAERNAIFKASSPETAFNALAEREPDLILLDLFLDGASGEDLLEEMLRNHPDRHIVIMTGSDSVKNAVSCIKKGAKDYFVKSADEDELMNNIRRIMRIRTLEKENEEIKKIAEKERDYGDFKEYITYSPAIFSLFEYVKSIAKTSNHILITGESGVGKGIFAKIISSVMRGDKPFISVNVAGYDDQMLADTLFGHIKGAFTGAASTRQGIIKKASDGVVFLDEIGDLSVQSQIKLLCLLQDGIYQQLGSDDFIKTPAKFIFATNQNLIEKMNDGRFRSDLYFRLSTHKIHIPPLRERPEDIMPLCSYFAGEAAKELGKAKPGFTESFKDKIMSMKFPGNIRQLRGAIYDLTARCGEIIDGKDVEKLMHTDGLYESRTKPRSGRSMDKDFPTIEETTDKLIKEALEISGGNQQRAAYLLGISQPTLSRRLKRMGL